MYSSSYDYEVGARQSLGPVVYGEKKLAQVTGQVSLQIRGKNFLDYREMYKGKPQYVEYENRDDLDIHTDDMVFVRRDDVPPILCEYKDPTCFASFNATKKLETAAEYRRVFRFLGKAMANFEFHKPGQGFGLDVAISGVLPFINSSGETLMPGDPLTWEPRLSHLADISEARKRGRRQYSAERTAVKGQFVKYVPGIDENTLDLFYPYLAEMKKKKVAAAAFEAESTKVGFEFFASSAIVGYNQEVTPTNHWGLVRLT